ncbi:MAG: hypothetical protein K8R88_12045 [Armatimonadetes bacterium]|nr:hypothetical protein [Armatimonadota bacterium]
MLKKSLCAISLIASMQAHAALTLLGQFPGGIGGIAGCGFDAGTDSVWAYGSFNAQINSYTRTGVANGSAVFPGETANDVDLEFAREGFTLGATALPPHTLLVENGETGASDVYAVNKTTGAVLAHLVTGFGVNHVVGIAYHPIRNTIFLLADKLDTINPSRVAEINPVTGAVLNIFPTTGFSINFGDIEVDPTTGNLLIVSSEEATVRVMSPTGTTVANLPYPSGVNSISGIGLDELRGEAFLSGVGGTIYRVGGFNVAGSGISGTISLESFLPSISGRTVDFAVYNAGGVLVATASDSIDAAGAYSFAFSGPDGTYSVIADANGTFLKRKMSVAVSGGNGVANFSMTNGDSVPDGVIDLSDYTAVVVAFNALPSSGNWNPDADVNADGVVDLTDYTVIVTNFNKVDDIP